MASSVKKVKWFKPLIFTGYLICAFCPIVTHGQTSTFLDLIVEGRTYTPYFYPGRSEPTAGNNVRLIVLSNDKSISTYRWHIGSEAFTTTEPYLDFLVPIIAGRLLVEITAINTNGATVARSSEYVSLSKPFILFYEDNELRGTSRTAVRSEHIMSGNEMTIKAEPYFAGTKVYSGLKARWSTNLVAETVPTDWRFLHIKREDDLTTAGEIKLDILNPGNPNEYLSSAFDLTL